MKKTIIILSILILPVAQLLAQDTANLSMKPVTHIQVSNEMYQNNSQFYNKGNFFDNSRVYTTANGTYWVPGYSNPANNMNGTINNGLAPNTSVNPINTYIQRQLNNENNTYIIPRNVIIK